MRAIAQRLPNLGGSYRYWSGGEGDSGRIFSRGIQRAAGRFRVWISWGAYTTHVKDARYVLDRDGDLEHDRRPGGNRAGGSNEVCRWHAGDPGAEALERILQRGHLRLEAREPGGAALRRSKWDRSSRTRCCLKKCPRTWTPICAGDPRRGCGRRFRIGRTKNCFAPVEAKFLRMTINGHKFRRAMHRRTGGLHDGRGGTQRGAGQRRRQGDGVGRSEQRRQPQASASAHQRRALWEQLQLDFQRTRRGLGATRIRQTGDGSTAWSGAATVAMTRRPSKIACRRPTASRFRRMGNRGRWWPPRWTGCPSRCASALRRHPHVEQRTSGSRSGSRAVGCEKGKTGGRNPQPDDLPGGVYRQI
jgi:hypothetical protein